MKYTFEFKLKCVERCKQAIEESIDSCNSKRMKGKTIWMPPLNVGKHPYRPNDTIQLTSPEKGFTSKWAAFFHEAST